MTFDEHAARAAIMDRTFDWRDGAYVHNLEIGDYVDCTTLEPVTMGECNKRMTYFHTKLGNMGMGRKDYYRWLKSADSYGVTLPWITSGGNDDG